MNLPIDIPESASAPVTTVGANDSTVQKLECKLTPRHCSAQPIVVQIEHIIRPKPKATEKPQFGATFSSSRKKCKSPDQQHEEDARTLPTVIDLNSRDEEITGANTQNSSPAPLKTVNESTPLIDDPRLQSGADQQFQTMSSVNSSIDDVAQSLANMPWRPHLREDPSTEYEVTCCGWKKVKKNNSKLGNGPVTFRPAIFNFNPPVEKIEDQNSDDSNWPPQMTERIPQADCYCVTHEDNTDQWLKECMYPQENSNMTNTWSEDCYCHRSKPVVRLPEFEPEVDSQEMKSYSECAIPIVEICKDDPKSLKNEKIEETSITTQCTVGHYEVPLSTKSYHLLCEQLQENQKQCEPLYQEDSNFQMSHDDSGDYIRQSHYQLEKNAMFFNNLSNDSSLESKSDNHQSLTNFISSELSPESIFSTEVPAKISQQRVEFHPDVLKRESSTTPTMRPSLEIILPPTPPLRVSRVESEVLTVDITDDFSEGEVGEGAFNIYSDHALGSKLAEKVIKKVHPPSPPASKKSETCSEPVTLQSKTRSISAHSEPLSTTNSGITSPRLKIILSPADLWKKVPKDSPSPSEKPSEEILSHTRQKFRCIKSGRDSSALPEVEEDNDSLGASPSITLPPTPKRGTPEERRSETPLSEYLTPSPKCKSIKSSPNGSYLRTSSKGSREFFETQRYPTPMELQDAPSMSVPQFRSEATGRKETPEEYVETCCNKNCKCKNEIPHFTVVPHCPAEVPICPAEVPHCPPEVPHCPAEVPRCPIEVPRCAYEVPCCMEEVSQCSAQVPKCFQWHLESSSGYPHSHEFEDITSGIPECHCPNQTDKSENSRNEKLPSAAIENNHPSFPPNSLNKWQPYIQLEPAVQENVPVVCQEFKTQHNQTVYICEPIDDQQELHSQTLQNPFEQRQPDHSTPLPKQTFNNCTDPSREISNFLNSWQNGSAPRPTTIPSSWISQESYNKPSMPQYQYEKIQPIGSLIHSCNYVSPQEQCPQETQSPCRLVSHQPCTPPINSQKPCCIANNEKPILRKESSWKLTTRSPPVAKSKRKLFRQKSPVITVSCEGKKSNTNLNSLRKPESRRLSPELKSKSPITEVEQELCLEEEDAEHLNIAPDSSEKKFTSPNIFQHNSNHSLLDEDQQTNKPKSIGDGNTQITKIQSPRSRNVGNWKWQPQAIVTCPKTVKNSVKSCQKSSIKKQIPILSQFKQTDCQDKVSQTPAGCQCSSPNTSAQQSLSPTRQMTHECSDDEKRKSKSRDISHEKQDTRNEQSVEERYISIPFSQIMEFGPAIPFNAMSNNSFGDSASGFSSTPMAENILRSTFRSQRLAVAESQRLAAAESQRLAAAESQRLAAAECQPAQTMVPLARVNYRPPQSTKLSCAGTNILPQESSSQFQRQVVLQTRGKTPTVTREIQVSIGQIKTFSEKETQTVEVVETQTSSYILDSHFRFPKETQTYTISRSIGTETSEVELPFNLSTIRRLFEDSNVDWPLSSNAKEVKSYSLPSSPSKQRQCHCKVPAPKDADTITEPKLCTKISRQMVLPCCPSESSRIKPNEERWRCQRDFPETSVVKPCEDIWDYNRKPIVSCCPPDYRELQSVATETDAPETQSETAKIEHQINHACSQSGSVEVDERQNRKKPHHMHRHCSYTSKEPSTTSLIPNDLPPHANCCWYCHKPFLNNNTLLNGNPYMRANQLPPQPYVRVALIPLPPCAPRHQLASRLMPPNYPLYHYPHQCFDDYQMNESATSSGSSMSSRDQGRAYLNPSRHHVCVTEDRHKLHGRQNYEMCSCQDRESEFSETDSGCITPTPFDNSVQQHSSADVYNETFTYTQPTYINNGFNQSEEEVIISPEELIYMDAVEADLHQDTDKTDEPEEALRRTCSVPKCDYTQEEIVKHLCEKLHSCRCSVERLDQQPAMQKLCTPPFLSTSPPLAHAVTTSQSLPTEFEQEVKGARPTRAKKSPRHKSPVMDILNTKFAIDVASSRLHANSSVSEPVIYGFQQPTEGSPVTKKRWCHHRLGTNVGPCSETANNMPEERPISCMDYKPSTSPKLKYACSVSTFNSSASSQGDRNPECDKSQSSKNTSPDNQVVEDDVLKVESNSDFESGGSPRPE